MKPEQIVPLAAAGESATLEFKKSTAEKDRACRTLCAFANGQGGRVLFGVTPAGKVVGQAVSDRTSLEERAQEFQGFEPPLFPAVERVPVDGGREVLVLTVARGARVPVAFRGVAYERVLNTTRTMPRETFQRLLLEEMHATERWENRPALGWDVSRLDRRELVLTLEESIRRGRIDDPGTREPLDMFSRYAGKWIPDTPARRRAVLDKLRTWNPFSNSSAVEGIVHAIRTFYEPGRKISIYVLGDEFTGDSIAQVIDVVDKINREGNGGGRLVRIHAIGFPTVFAAPANQQITGIRFASLMRDLSWRNNGTFVGLNDFR